MMRGVGLVAMMIVLTQSAGLAASVGDLDALPLVPGSLIYVEDGAGNEMLARFVRASRAELVVEFRNNRRVIAGPDVQAIWRRGDRLRNGALIGGVLGLLGGIAGQSRCTDCTSAVAVGIVIGVPLWAAIGTWIDSAHVGRTLVYRAP
ncbi:MAG: hypothetical protein ABL993_05700 [Vicinamibacterales bacterium]